MCFNPSPVRRVPSPNRYMAVARFCFCKNNKRTIDSMLHFCRIYAYWPDKQGKSAWEKLDAHGPHALCHDEARDLHRFGSYVTGYLPRTHPLVENETLDDRALT